MKQLLAQLFGFSLCDLNRKQKFKNLGKPGLTENLEIINEKRYYIYTLSWLFVLLLVWAFITKTKQK